ncbi:MAG: GNAT family N-acetyltransferase [bacterium]|nr:GNAT family N-acetyltransferase [bacterium]
MPSQNPSPDHVLSLRPITPEDEDFLRQLYASTREDELAPLDWNEDQKQAFLTMQFEAQHKFYLEQFSQAEFNVILLNGEPVGRLYTDLRPDEIRIIDIALLTAYRRQGIGSIYLNDVLAQARAAGLAVRIHVEHYNPAMSVYKRLGFQKIGDNGVYFLMEWLPDSQ